MTEIGLVVPTLNAGPRWDDWLCRFGRQTLTPDFPLVVDSTSSDDTVERARGQGMVVCVIPRAEFNHGGTRLLAVRMMPKTDIVVFLTQDALLAKPDAIERLVAAFDDPKVGAAYGRQLPHLDAGPIGAHARLFNYPAVSQVRVFEDRAKWGLKTVFISNSFAAYRRSALLEVGGFPTDTIMNEDTFVAGKLLMAGWKVAYCADAEVYHSHDYGYGEELKRYFDIGVFHSRQKWLQEIFGKAEGEGRRFVLSELRYLVGRAPWLIPSALLRTALKWLGYKLGSCSDGWLPVAIKRKFSMHRGYWSEA
jgi:rhamnosyltransferase